MMHHLFLFLFEIKIINWLYRENSRGGSGLSEYTVFLIKYCISKI